MPIKTERLLIRRVSEKDRESIKVIWEDFNSSEFSKYDRPHSTKDEEVAVRRAQPKTTSATSATTA